MENPNTCIDAPSAFLQHIVGRPVLVRLSSGIDYKGVCIIFIFCFIDFSSQVLRRLSLCRSTGVSTKVNRLLCSAIHHYSDFII
ncbi:hypothetical protein PORY_002780 [Pneumocystis oryctolagi]|uniref:Uncharacterized protein n=1 Tax=Pneumocystis oryctolagi TaxID=42067 RepID=A0ACB7C9U2_9ASCO|nr:hypothetical protein PORY_002780 [Pneumocystis oryctolagi]